MKNPFTCEAAVIQEIDLIDRRIAEAKSKLDFKRVKKLESLRKAAGAKLAESRTGVLL